ncbi:hypothetical protein HAX54_049736 [Datura stramonium]|uniref:Fungal lipase-like domain-containing protein n=1 Tax=Datura stramonium TaxID=4076 RepID=A0ABS8WKP0_DATST|nr:hypothetical protein [Datura stramonium]
MASDRDQIFSLSGPIYLTTILDWRNASHRRSIAASLVKGVSTLERDRQQNRQGPHALAQPWWESFNFRLIQTLVDGKDRSIFGAIFQYKFPNYMSSHNYQNPPNYVIAFRGTIMKRKSISQDLKLNLRIIVNRQCSSSRFSTGLQAVQNIIQNHGISNIWLAGHSKGSAIALIIGRDMAKIGIHLETYLFNPPFASLPIDKINNDTLKHGIRCAHSLITGGLAFTVNMMSTSTNRPSDNDDTFTKLCGWIPYLFVNPSDLICSGYLGYFEHMEKMIESGADEMARIVTRNSIRSIIATAIGKESEPSQNLPSAYVITNLSPRPYPEKLAHGVSQWWTPDLRCNYKRYQFW